VTKTGAKSAGSHKNDAILFEPDDCRAATFSKCNPVDANRTMRKLEFHFAILGSAWTPAEVQWLARCGEAKARPGNPSIARSQVVPSGMPARPDRRAVGCDPLGEF
jgi:hypothetical protein